jgi:importin subunit alpha-6/7
MLRLRKNLSQQVVVELLHCLSNITAGTTEQKQDVSSAGLFTPVREIFADGDYKAKKEACHVIRNAVDRDATPEHFRYFFKSIKIYFFKHCCNIIFEKKNFKGM